ncbi:hypothetical protein NP233_g265 [Leucocoprinus birnbaumii]|uniref:Uncharacterized protein n=1 Tax=Leucocoprinus birnbaumii TaxID=56174 RepID=A0AAD5W2I5_9AGAR|nr:hypothetical protein NP233_g265 [Leucocoprinus birnbaumii]
MPSGSPSLPPQSTRQFFARTFFEDGIYYYEVDPYDIISILIETVCYGVFLILFALSTYLLVQRRRYYLRKSNEKRRLRSIMIYQVTGVLMFLTITAKWSFWWAEVFPIHNSQESGVPTRLPRLKRISYRMEEVVTQLTIVLGDLITIYRLWILSSRNKPMIVFPILAFFGYLACAISLSGPVNDTTDKPIPIRDGKLRMTNWDIAVVTSTVSITVYIVVAIAWIILRTRYKVASTKISGSRSLNQALVILVESAALYALSRSVYRAKEVLLQITVILGDLVTIYRLWILSSRSKITVAFPIVSLIGFLVCIIMLWGPLSGTLATPIPVIDGKLEMKPWDFGAVAATVSITVYITLMIGWIILKARIRTGVMALGQGFTHALTIVVESATIYTIWNLMLIISGAAFQSPVALCFFDSVPAIYGISVTLINVRVGLGWARGDERVAVVFPNARQNPPGSPGVEQRATYLSTLVITESSEISEIEFGTCTESRDDFDQEVAGNLASASQKPSPI